MLFRFERTCYKIGLEMDTPLVHRLKKDFSRDVAVEMAMLIGSGAEGNLTPESDLDVAVSLGRAMSVEERMLRMERLAVWRAGPWI